MQVPADPLGLTVFGRGWYFSKYASHAHHYTAGGGCLLLAEVAVGNVETVVRRDASRGAPSAGFDSIVIPGDCDRGALRAPLLTLDGLVPALTLAMPGRTLPSQSGVGGAREMNEEYVVFDGSQALPLCLLFYEPEAA